MNWKNDQFRLASVILLTATFIIGAVAMEGVVSWVMMGLLGVLVPGGVLTEAGFGKSETGGIPLKPREGRSMKRKSKLVFASVVLMTVLGVFVMGGVQSVATQTVPSAIYATSAKDIRIVPLVQGDIPDLDNGTDMTASATCQTDLTRPANIYSLNSTGDFLAIWWNADEDTACYSRFTPDGNGSFTEDHKGEWYGGATSVWQSPYTANMWSPLPPADLNADQKDDLVLVRWFISSGSSSKSAEYKVAFGKGDGSFDFSDTPTTFVTGAWTGSAMLADADDDGYADLVYYSFKHGGSQSTNFYMLKGKGDGTFSNVADKKLLISTESSQSSSSAVIADFNSDGHPDIFLTPDDDISDEGQAYIAFGQGGGTFGPIQESIDFVPSDEGWSHDTFSASAQAYDVNMNGHIDIVANESTWDVQTVKSVWWGDGNGQFSATGEILYSAPSGTPYPKIDWLSVPSASDLSVTPRLKKVSSEAGTISVDVNTNNCPIDWTATASDSWLTIDSGTSGTNSGTITVSYDANSGDARTGTITVTAPGAENSPQTVEVRQAKAGINCEARLSLPTNAQACPGTSVSIPLSIDEFSPWLLPAYNISAQSDLKNAYTAAVAFFLFGDPGGTLTIDDLEGNGYSATEGVNLEIISGQESTMEMTAYHTCGDKLYTVKIDGPPFTEEDAPGFGGIQSIDIKVGFDETVLTPTGATLAGGILENSGYTITDNTTDGAVTVSINDNGDMSADNGVFAYLNFNVNGNEGDTTNLSFTRADINGTSAGTITGLFEVKCGMSVTITPKAGTGGAISPADAVTVGYGSDRTFTITPDTCRTIADVLADGSSVGAVSSYTFTNVTEDHTIEVVFSQKSLTITAQAGTGGSISPSGNVTAACGEDRKFTITPDAGYKVKDVLVDGSSVGDVTTYTFADVTSEHTIDAVFINIIQELLPVVVLDMDISTPEIEPTVSACENEVWIAVVAQRVTDLDTYQVEVNFDTDRLEFLEGAENNLSEGIVNLLKQNRGTTVGFRAVEQPDGTVNIANSLAYSDCNLAPEGSGVIALLKFKVLDVEAYSDAQLTLANVFFDDCNGYEEEITNLTNGTITIDCDPCLSCDFHTDGIVNYLDLALFADQWLFTCNDPGWDPEYDLVEDSNCIVNYKDLGFFADCWLEEIP